MIHFVICDDEKAVCAELEQTVTQILTNLNIKHEIDVFFCPEELEKQIKNGATYDLMFLDIEYFTSKLNGIDLGKLIRDVYENDQVAIVFISRETKYALELFEVQPLNFLIKPLQREKIIKVINKYLTLAGLRTKEFSYKKGRNIFKVPLGDILYIESIGRKLYLHLVDGKEEEFYGSLKDTYESQLQKYDFLFIHASYVVNYDHISALTFSHVRLSQGETSLPISKHRQEEVRAIYQKIFKRRML